MRAKRAQTAVGGRRKTAKARDLTARKSSEPKGGFGAAVSQSMQVLRDNRGSRST